MLLFQSQKSIWIGKAKVSFAKSQLKFAEQLFNEFFRSSDFIIFLLKYLLKVGCFQKSKSTIHFH